MILRKTISITFQSVQIVTGIQKTDGKYVTFTDRIEAIHYAIDNAQPGDIILVAGKGHEMYQEIEGIKHPFNEAEIICDYLKQKESAGR